jgi:hypothetical protein
MSAESTINADWDTTGGLPPSACRAPCKKGGLVKLRAAKEKRQEARHSHPLYAATTGFRPPSECRAPYKGKRTHSMFARNE